jgi:hypothetical protein
MRDRIVGKANTIFPFVMLFIALLGILVIFIFKQTKITVTVLLFAVPIIMSSFILIRTKTRASITKLPDIFSKIRFFNVFLVNILVFIITLIMLVSSDTRPLAYFVLIPIYSGIIFLQILMERSKTTDYYIVFEIVLLSLNLLWGTTLKYPLYFADTDTLVHLDFINSIVKTGSINSLLTDYLHYPFYHIFSAITSELTAISVRTSLFLFMGIIWQLGIMFMYLIVRDLSSSRKFPLITCLLYATSSQIILYGSYPIARSLALILLLFWLYLIFNKAQNNNKYYLLSLIVLIAMILTHQVNVLYSIPILILIYIWQLIIKQTETNQIIKPSFIYLFVICSVSYLIWVASNMSNTKLPEILRLMLNNSSGTSNIVQEFGVSMIWGLIYYAFILFLSILGIRRIFTLIKYPQASSIVIYGLSGFVLLVLFIPGPTDILSLSNILLLWRFPLIVTPFVILIVALGIYTYYDIQWLNNHLKVIPLVLITLMTFFSMISTGNAQDVDYFPHTKTADTPYFSNGEIASFVFLKDNADYSMTLYADYQTMRNQFMLGDFSSQIIEQGDISYIDSGYLLLRVGELERKKSLSFSLLGGQEEKGYRYSINLSEPKENILLNLVNKNLIYIDNGVQLYIISK